MNKSLSIPSIPLIICSLSGLLSALKSLNLLISIHKICFISSFDNFLTFVEPFSGLSRSFWNGGTWSSRHIYLGSWSIVLFWGFSLSIPFSTIQNFSLLFLICVDIFIELILLYNSIIFPKISYPTSNNELKIQHFTCKNITFPPIYITSLILISYFKATLQLALDFTAKNNRFISKLC